MALWPCLAPPLPTRTTPCGPATPPWPCRPRMRRYAEEVRRTQGLELQMRVGLNSGEVVVRAIGNDLHMDYSAVGQTTHLAARMEQLATPGTHPADRRHPAAGRRAWCRSTPWGRCRSRAWPSPWRSLSWSGPVRVRRRLQAAAARGLTRFVGRAAGAGGPAPGAGAGQGGARPGGGPGRRGGRGQVAPGV